MASNFELKKGFGRVCKVCPECGEFSLILVQQKTEKDGVEYTKKIMECDECGFVDDYHVSPKRFKDVFNPHW